MSGCSRPGWDRFSTESRKRLSLRAQRLIGHRRTVLPRCPCGHDETRLRRGAGRGDRRIASIDPDHPDFGSRTRFLSPGTASGRFRQRTAPPAGCKTLREAAGKCFLDSVGAEIAFHLTKSNRKSKHSGSVRGEFSDFPRPTASELFSSLPEPSGPGVRQIGMKASERPQDERSE